MSTFRAGEEWADAHLEEAMRRSLGSLAAHAGMVSSLDGALRTVARRVQRRRAAKQAGIAITALAAATVLAVGGAMLLPVHAGSAPGDPVEGGLTSHRTDRPAGD